MDGHKHKLIRILAASEWSTEDQLWLLKYLENNDTTELQQIMQQEFNLSIQSTDTQEGEKAIALLKRLHEKISLEQKPAKFFQFITWRWAAAAAVFLVLVGIGYLLLGDKNENRETVKTQPVEGIKNDITPGGDKAILTLADGSQIILDSAHNGDLANQGNVKVIKLNGQLAYKGTGGSAEVLYNTISTPRGGQYQLLLADGSKVWLNAASSLRFPASFIGKERLVELTGEGYFEIAKNENQPFKVDIAGKGVVEVLGTHFNINAYSDAASIKTTLLEGRVKVAASGGATALLKPGEQAQINGGIKLVNDVDTDEIIAWKAGLFQFNRADVVFIMRQVSRWYNVDVVFEGPVSMKSFSGIVSRSNNVSEVLKIMEKAGVKFKINGNRITVMQ